MQSAAPHPGSAPPPHHVAAVCEDDADLVRRAAAWIDEGIRRGEWVAAVLGAERARAVATRLGPAGDEVAFLSAEAMGRRVGVAFRRLRGLLEARPASGRPLRIVVERPETGTGELLPGELRERLHCDALCTSVLEDHGGSCLCLYPRVALGDDGRGWVAGAHPHLLSDGEPHGSRRHLAPSDMIARGQAAVAEYATPGRAQTIALTGPADIGEVRAAVRAAAIARRAGEDQAHDFLVAVSEIATNALVHGAAPAVAAIWGEGRRVVCDVRDGGDGPVDPLTGYLPAPPESRGGRGMWLARQLATLVEVGHGDQGTLVRLQMQAEVGGDSTGGAAG